jgi:hypothetical protein
MKSLSLSLVGALALLVPQGTALAEIKTTVEYNPGDSAKAGFKFKNVPAPSRNDAATAAKFTLADGRRDANGGALDKLHDGQLPEEGDQPSENFFFAQNTDGGRIVADLGSALEVKVVNTYSWHSGPRGPQVYQLYASDGKAADFNAAPKKGTDPEKCGWKLITKVDTRPKQGDGGGQYGVSITNTDGILGQYRYLLFDISRTEADDPFGNTFYSEIDIVDRNGPAPEAVAGAGGAGSTETRREVVEAGDGKYQLTIETSQAADLTDWAHNVLAPVVKEWYPKLVQLLPSEGYQAPTRVSIIFNRSGGVAATGGTRVTCSAAWFRQNLKGEAVGAVVHELVHVVQQYGRAPRGSTRPPGWLTEGIADYVRWFRYEPQTRGAEITARNVARARYDASYRITGNFLNAVSQKYDTNFVTKVNAAIREGKYSDDLWKKLTGKTAPELGDEWKKNLETKLGTAPTNPAPPAEVKPAPATESKINILTDAEKAAGWQLLFNGTDLNGWHNFKRAGVRPGWQVKDGALVCANPANAGDIVTSNQFEWFELQLDYNISHAGNSGILYHVTEQGGATWATGPEFQLEDNKEAADPVRCGWLYALYQPPNDPKTDKPLDATKPVGEWNHVRLLISPEKCEHEINGVKYFEYVLGSDDFKARVAKSKFAKMPLFAKSNTGSVSLQGDHGQVSFRNIKIRPIPPK